MGKIEEEDETYEDEGKEDWEEKNVWLFTIYLSKKIILILLSFYFLLHVIFCLWISKEKGKIYIS